MLSLCLVAALSPGVMHNGVAAMDQRPDRPRPGEARPMTPTLPEDELVRRYLGGQRDAFHELTVRYYRPVGAFLLKRVQRPDVVEDLAQETFLEALRSLKAGKRPEHFSSWLFGIAVNVCGKWLRRRKPALFDPADPPVTPAGPSFTVEAEEREEQQRRLAALEDGLAGLPAATRTLLEMKHRQGKTCEQIAVELRQPVGTVKSSLSRAYKALRERLAPGGEAS
jgi:RNA polymerase sigma-70 factor, ECF subfamily